MTTKTKHQHRVSKTETRPFMGAVGTKQNPAAHGGVCEVSTCKCGATRRTNVNGRHIERGYWTLPEGR